MKFIAKNFSKIMVVLMLIIAVAELKQGLYKDAFSMFLFFLMACLVEFWEYQAEKWRGSFFQLLKDVEKKGF